MFVIKRLRMNKIIEEAINLTQKEIKRFPNKILSESDFERMLAKHLEYVLLREESEFSVHTQVSYYEESGCSSPKYRVDILLMKEEEIEECKKNHKGFVYGGSSYVFELKYLHKNNSANVIRLDMEKSKLFIGNGGVLYVVVLLENKRHNKEEDIKHMWYETCRELGDDKKDMLKCSVLYKYD